ncbi:MAG: radical SAM/SPASM domain-containing protein, partial [Candidatus Hodarchaeota archaeon]
WRLDNHMNNLCNVNVELTDRCNKNCWMCGRRKRERENSKIKYDEMDFSLVETIAQQLPDKVVVQLHNNGEGLLYSNFGDAVAAFHRQITTITTNGKLLMEKRKEIIDNLDTLALSVIEKDVESTEQYEIFKQFMKIKENRKPFVVIRMVGRVDRLWKKRYEQFELPMTYRILHSPDGSFDYQYNPVIPEIGICLDFLNHLAINREGEVSICVRYDPKRLGVIGNANKQLLKEIWEGHKRGKWLEYHLKGERDKVPLCKTCEFWGIPTKG